MKIVVVEDEAQVAQRVIRLTKKLFPDRIDSLQAFSSLEKAKDSLIGKEIDLLLLDLNLNGENGFALLQSIIAEPFHTIIVSAYKEQALRAFEYGVLDFVPKPIAEDRLKAAFDRFEGLTNAAQPPPKRLAIKLNGRIEFIPLTEVDHICGASDYAEVHLRSGKSYLSDKTLDSLELILHQDFIRIHRSHIARRDRIANLRAAEGSRYSIELSSGLQLPVGRSKVARLREELAL